MLFNENLNEIVFHRHELFQTDELIIISGYVGPAPIERLGTLPFPTRVIYGMYGSEGIQRTLHYSLVNLQNTVGNVDIYYSLLPVHSKCYLWKFRGNIVHALVGSANFSTNGLTTPFREILAETTFDTFLPLQEYSNRVINNSMSCLETHDVVQERPILQRQVCELTLLERSGEVQNTAGLNWGQNPNNHTRRDDAYIKIGSSDIRSFPDLFPPKQVNPLRQDERGRERRHNDAIEIIWDDGISMEGLLEGTMFVNGLIYPKQISSFPRKSELGEYMRNRINVPLGQPVRRHHLERYGRTTISVSLINEGVYKFDFSAP